MSLRQGFAYRGGRDAFERISVQGKRYDGIFCANDFCAMGVLEAAEKHGIIPGKDIAVIGIDDTEVSGFSKISLTSIRQPYNRLAAIAMEELIKAIRADSMPNIKRKLPAELMVRKSSRLES